MPLSLDRLQVGHRYTLRNYDEIVQFEIIRRTAELDYQVKQLDTLEVFPLSELIRFGKGEDFELLEITD